ncbi:hypothetical protein FB192DRAFT_1120437 [Mucor lusitanicus]|uniref:C2 domain-containing protein n=2 Tax=Mucor circinelloides f. lusitanicus TaxID=29924 RepID=A0A168IFV8_MUCCL|nr:hypothetical protein FB192DRAFT_1120437 [Mucor lusitanicus]OAC99917.1 hypothetical protein MUCCIDRAFT_113362 [Mucor lusitanicus CBS 277.49]
MVLNTQLSALLVDWTTALVNNDIAQVQKYLTKEPELLWTPIPQALDNLDHLEQRLVESNKLGSTFQPVSAIHFTCLYMNQEDRFRLLAYLIEQSSLHDLDTRFWGECNNSTLHLVCFLENTQIARLLMDKGVSATPSNDLGYVPSDITSSDTILQYLKQQKQQQLSRNRSVRPNYSTPDRFKLLRELAEETTNTAGEDQKKLEISLDRQKSDGRFFRKGRVKETQQKVLTEEEAELEKQRLKRQKEVAQLVKKSAVKNNPLFMKLEKKAYTLPSPPSKSAAVDSSTAPTTGIAAEDEQDSSEHPAESASESKRNSRVISSLKVNSYVSSSIFVQADEDAIEPKSPPPAITTTTDSHQTNDGQDDNKVCTTSTLSVNETQAQIFSTEPDELLDDEQSSLPVDQPKMASVLSQETSTPTPTHSADTEEEEESTDEDEDDESDGEDYFDSNTNGNVVNSPSSLSKINYSPAAAAAAADKKTVYPDIRTYYEHNKAIKNAPQHNQRDEETEDSDVEDDEDEDDDDEEIVPVQFATRLASPIYKSVKILNEDRRISPTLDKVNETHAFLPPENQAMDVMEQTQTSASNKGAAVTDAPSVEPSKSSPPVRPQRSDLRRNSSTTSNMSGNAIAALKQLEKQDSKEMKRMSGSQKAAWTMSMSSWAAILDREFNLEELDQEKKLKEMQRLHQASNRTQETVVPPTTDYLGSDKVEVSDQDVDFMLRQDSLLPNSRTSLDKTLAADSMLSLSLNFTDFETPVIPKVAVQKSISTNTSAPQIGEIPRLNASKSVRRKPITSSLSEPNIQQPQQPRVKQYNITLNKTPFKKSGHGKLYLHVNGIQDILLPLPKDRAYVRCVVSDGRFEYMSRYEILSQNINFDYECVIDTHPDMIITISLHVRPDYVMKSRTPFSRLFSKKKKKECLSGYVNKEDGAIGQARFALAHMLPVCQQNSYLAGFHCFNAWYSRSFKERHRQKKKKRDPDQDVLKVVGNFDVEMLYLPVDDYNQKQPFPRNLRECDEIIKQLHQSVESTTKASTSLSPSPSERYHTF